MNINKGILKWVKGAVLFLAFVVSVPLCAQEAEQTEVQPNDSIDRMAEDFVTASICIADPTRWQDDFLGVLGHAFIHLQCPTFGYDYSFSYESENAKDEVSRFLKGQLRMGMFREPFDEYIKTFQKWNCAIHEYKLNLPPEAELRLWEIMDNKVDEGEDLEFDLVRRGCTQTLVMFVNQALGTTYIQYGEWPEEFNLTRREMINARLEQYPWIRFLLADLLVDDDFNAEVENEEKILYPSQLEYLWQRATIDGKPLMTYMGDTVKAPAPVVEDTLFTPMLLALIVLAITAVLAFSRITITDWMVLTFQFLVGLLLCWLVLASNLPGTKGAHLLPLYNPLPLLLWKWRKHWALPYIGILIVWILIATLGPSLYVEPAHFVFAATIAVILLKATKFRLPLKR